MKMGEWIFGSGGKAVRMRNIVVTMVDSSEGPRCIIEIMYESGRVFGVTIEGHYELKRVDDADAMDWEEAAAHLETVERAYREIGFPGVFALTAVIAPARRRFDDGERTQDLYDEIMAIAL